MDCSSDAEVQPELRVEKRELGKVFFISVRDFKEQTKKVFAVDSSTIVSVNSTMLDSNLFAIEGLLRDVV